MTKMHLLSYDEYQALALSLSRELFQVGGKGQYSQKIFEFWAWTAQILLQDQKPKQYPNPATAVRELDYSLKMLIKSSYRTALAIPEIQAKPPAPPNPTYEEHLAYCANLKHISEHRDQLAGKNLILLQRHTPAILTYLTFPLLEALCKHLCYEYIEEDKVVKEFPRSKNNTCYKKGQYCSSLEDLLGLLYAKVVSADFKAVLDDFFDNIKAVIPKPTAFSTIYKWRNSAVHGDKSDFIIGGLLLNLCSLIAVSELKDCYDEHRKYVWKSIDFFHTLGTEFPGEQYYPPSVFYGVVHTGFPIDCG